MIISTMGMAFADTTNQKLNIENITSGYVTITVNTINEVRVTISKDDLNSVFTLNETTNLPLTMGNGVYSIVVYEKIDGRFIQQESSNVTLNLIDDSIIYLNSVQSVNWSLEMNAIVTAQALTVGMTTDREKIQAIHQYVVSNIQYDYAKAKAPGGNYIPSIDATLEAGNGICYDYSSLLASMLRSVGVPTRLTIGHLGSLYHAWNEVYLADTDEWMTMDTTNDALYYQYGLNYQMFKTSPMYDVEIMY
jgi:hypothetical protein